MPRTSVLAPAILALLCAAPVAPASDSPASVHADTGSAIPPLRATLDASRPPEEQTIRLPAGRWEIRLRSNDFHPLLEITTSQGRELAERLEPRRGDGVMIPLELDAPGDIRVRVRGVRADDTGDYLLTVNPAPGAAPAEPVASQELDIRPSLTYPLADGDHAAAPVCLMLDAGKRYRIASRCDNGRTWLLAPAQHGLPRRLGSLALGDTRDDAEITFVAPRTGLYVFWCLAGERDFRMRATVRAEARPLAATLPRPSAAAFLSRVSSRELTVWKRRDFNLRPGDPEVFVPCPARAKMRLELIAGDDVGACTVVCADRELPLVAPRGGMATENVTLPEGADGVRLRAHPDSRAPALLSISTDLPRAAETPVRTAGTLACALPAVLRAKVKAGDRVGVAVRGAGVSPQLVLRGAGILAACTDPNGRSPLAAADGIATRDGIVETLVAAGGAEREAFAECAFLGFDPQPDGRGPAADLPDLTALAMPGKRVFGATGTLDETSPVLADGSRVAWFRIPVKGGRLYRVLADAEFPPDLALDVPGEGKRLDPCGLAILRPKSDGEVTLGLATPGANLAGDFAMSVADLGPEAPAGSPPVKSGSGLTLSGASILTPSQPNLP